MGLEIRKHNIHVAMIFLTFEIKYLHYDNKYHTTIIIGKPYNWRFTLKLLLNGILNWPFCIPYGKKSMVIV